MEELRKITYGQAIREAIDEEMSRDENVILLGEDVGKMGGNWTTSQGLLEKYGEWRVRDTPISEGGFTGLAIGAAFFGARPIVEIMFADFMMVCFDMLENEMCKYSYMTGGQVKVPPMVVRTPMGMGRSSAANHSQTPTAYFAHIPGIKVVAPSNAAEAKGLLKSAIRDNNPVIFLESKLDYSKKFMVPSGEYTIPLDKARIAEEGTDLTVVSYGSTVNKVLKATKKLKEEGIHAEVIDLRMINPMDFDTIIASVKKTGKLLIVDEDTESFSITGEITYQVQQQALDALKCPVERLNYPNLPIPYSPGLEFKLIIDDKKIYSKIKSML